MAVDLFFDAVRLDEAADADAPLRRDVFRREVGRAIEKDEVVAKGGEHESGRRAERDKAREYGHKAAPLARHRRSGTRGSTFRSAPWLARWRRQDCSAGPPSTAAAVP